MIWQEPPPFVQYMAEAEAVGRMTFAAGMCSASGVLATDERAVVTAVDAFQRRAVIARVWGPVVEQAYRDGIATERAEFALMNDVAESLSERDRDARVQDLTDYLVDRCGGLLRDFPDVVAPD